MCVCVSVCMWVCVCMCVSVYVCVCVCERASELKEGFFLKGKDSTLPANTFEMKCGVQVRVFVRTT